MSWWKNVQTIPLEKEAGLIDWFRRHTGVSIPALILGGLVVMKGLDSFVSQLRNIPSQVAKDQYVASVINQVEAAFERNPAVFEEAKQIATEQETVEPGPETVPSYDPSLPRGIRNNNPGNIDWKENINWQGTAEDDEHDSRFVRFQSPEYGIRAMARVLRNYQKRYGLDTIAKIINRWAPPAENDTGAYVRVVSKMSQVPANQKLNLENDQQLAQIIKAMIYQENGRNPYSDEEILKGIQLEKP